MTAMTPKGLVVVLEPDRRKANLESFKIVVPHAAKVIRDCLNNVPEERPTLDDIARVIVPAEIVEQIKLEAKSNRATQERYALIFTQQAPYIPPSPGPSSGNGCLPIKCVFVGDESAGTTDLLLAYTTGKASGEYHPTVFDNQSFNHILDGNIFLSVGFYDLRGQTRQLRNLTYPGADVFILCFSIAAPDSLNAIRDEWSLELGQFPSVPIVLVATEVHLRNDPRTLEQLKRKGLAPITNKEGVLMAVEINAVKYIECSSASLEGINAVGTDAIRIGYDFKKKEVVKGRKCIVL